MKKRISKLHYEQVYSSVESWLRAIGLIADNESLMNIPGLDIDKQFMVTVEIGKTSDGKT